MVNVRKSGRKRRRLKIRKVREEKAASHLQTVSRRLPTAVA
jgi:hypothetical protein